MPKTETHKTLLFFNGRFVDLTYKTVSILHFNFCCCKHWLGAVRWRSLMVQPGESGRWPLEVTCRAGFISFNVTRNHEVTVI